MQMRNRKGESESPWMVPRSKSIGSEVPYEVLMRVWAPVYGWGGAFTQWLGCHVSPDIAEQTAAAIKAVRHLEAPTNRGGRGSTRHLNQLSASTSTGHKNTARAATNKV